MSVTTIIKYSEVHFYAIICCGDVMKNKLYNWFTLWLTYSVIFFFAEYLTDWLEVVTLGGLAAGAFIEGFFLLLGTGLMRIVVSKEFKQLPLKAALSPSNDMLKALVVVAAFSWEGALTLSHIMPGYTLHTHAWHLLFLLLLYPIAAIILDLICKKEQTN